VSCLGRKGFPATATLAGIGIGYFKADAIQAVAEINNGSSDIFSAKGIDQNRYSVHDAGEIVSTLFVKNHRVLHSRATALFDVNAQRFAGVFWFTQYRFDFLGRADGEAHNRFSGNIQFHINFEKLKRIVCCCQMAKPAKMQWHLLTLPPSDQELSTALQRPALDYSEHC